MCHTHENTDSRLNKPVFFFLQAHARLALDLREEALLLQLKKMFYWVAYKSIPIFNLNRINKSFICGIHRFLLASLDIPLLRGNWPMSRVALQILL